MVGRAQVLLRIRVLPVALFGRGDGGACDRVPAARPDSAALRALFGAGRAQLGLEDRRPGTPVQAQALPVAAARAVPPVRRPPLRWPPPRAPQRDPMAPPAP